MSSRPLRIGTRGSPMALYQSGLVRDRLVERRRRALAAKVCTSPVRDRDAQADPVEPGRDPRRAVEGVQPPVNDEENFLKQIFQIAARDAEALQGPPDEIGVGVMDLRDRDATGLSGDALGREHTRHEMVNAGYEEHPSNDLSEAAETDPQVSEPSDGRALEDRRTVTLDHEFTL